MSRIFVRGPWHGLFAVADGLGGHGGGGEAARLAVSALEAMATSIEVNPDLEVPEVWSALQAKLDKSLVAARSGRPQFANMGTTLTALALRGAEAHVFHAGDSRLYRFQSSEPTLLTEDHNVAFRLVQEGTLRPEEFAGSPMRRRLYRYLGKGESPSQALDHLVFTLHRGDRFLLTTDGCEDGNEPPRWEAGYNPESLIAAIFERADERSLSDNASAVAVALS